MAHSTGLFNCVLQNLLGSGREVKLSSPVLSGPGQAFYDFLYPFSFQTQFTEHATSNPTLFTNQSKEQVFGPDVVMAHPLGFLVSQAQHPARPLRETLHASQVNTS
jgi:hypothetical protein